jgi:glycosyltransferase involved in cell wall biosynthesis
MSVAIPVHDPESKHQKYLEHALQSIQEQSVKPQEVLLSSNHLISYKNQLLEKFGELNITFIQNNSVSATQNLNILVSCASSDIVKILFQDDFLIDFDSLARSSQLGADQYWRISAFKHANARGDLGAEIYFPLLTPHLIRGINQIGAPSIVSFRRENYVRFDERMVYLFDCDWYLRMAHNNGYPEMDSNPDVAVRIHKDQATHWAKTHKEREIKISLANHGATSNGRCRCV